MKKIIFTQKGYDDLKKEYKKLLDSRPEAVKTLTRAREMGDLSENGFYKAAKWKLSSIDYNLRRLKSLIKQAVVVQASSKEIVEVGNKVSVVGDNKIVRNFEIVGRYESDPSSNKISDQSPIGKSLINKRVGDEVKVSTPKGIINYKIIKII